MSDSKDHSEEGGSRPDPIPLPDDEFTEMLEARVAESDRADGADTADEQD